MNKILAGLLTFLVSFSVYAESGHTLVIRKYVMVNRKTVTLGDLAVLPESLSPLENLAVIESPDVGRHKTVSAEKLGSILRSYSGALKKFKIKIPETVTIAQIKTGDDFPSINLNTRIEMALASLLPDMSWTVHVSDVQLPKDLNEAGLQHAEIVPPLSRPKGLCTLQLKIPGVPNPRTIWIQARVKYTARVPILLAPVQAGESASSDNVKWQVRDVTYLSSLPAAAGDLNNSSFQLGLETGQIVLRSALTRQLAVHFGQEVELRAQDDAITVTTKGVVQQNGYLGDWVKVRTSQSQKYVSGIVTDKGVVRVQL